MATTMHVHIVSAEAQIFSGLAKFVSATGLLGELGIYPQHTALLTGLKRGHVRVVKSEAEEEVFYVEGGILEVQPSKVTVLADSVIRAAALDEAAALAVKERAEQLLKDRRTEIDYAAASAELAQAIAQLQAIRKLKKNYKG